MFITSCVVYYKYQNQKYTIDGFIHKATHSFKSEDYFQALRYYKKLILMGVKNEKIYINTAISLIRLGYYQKAVEQLLKTEKEFSPSSEIYYLIAYSYYLKNNKKEFNLITKYLEKSIDADTRNRNSYILLGKIYEDTNMYENARKLYRKALFEDIDNISEFYGLIANTYFKENRFDEAMTYYNRALKSNKNYISTYYNIAEIYKSKKEFDKAEDIYKKAIQISPDYITPYYQIGNLYFNKQEYDIAIDWYKKALEIEPNEEFVNYYIGIAYKRQNKLKEAIEHLKLAAYCGNDDAVKELRELLVTF
ncbi:MAG: tetratricopeptide repeat protein [Elusimicrobia bacterium]|nr:tetratricopeptide repeat protein [Elusimicrobiota bacterium]